jgi:hypothetical protein
VTSAARPARAASASPAGTPAAIASSSSPRSRGSVVLWLHTAPTPARTAAHRAATAMLAEAMTAPTAPVRSQRPTSENVMAGPPRR